MLVYKPTCVRLVYEWAGGNTSERERFETFEVGQGMAGGRGGGGGGNSNKSAHKRIIWISLGRTNRDAGSTV